MLRRWKVLPAAAMVSCFTGGWYLQRQLAGGGDVYQQARLFENVLAHVRDYHVDSTAAADDGPLVHAERTLDPGNRAGLRDGRPGHAAG
ncbi:MAG: hypothetical protein H0X69_04945 [Gemmatimonadales bacterium]|nr:hypothetical protein [Gemmatimonadales bacterium]